MAFIIAWLESVAANQRENLSWHFKLVCRKNYAHSILDAFCGSKSFFYACWSSVIVCPSSLLFSFLFVSISICFHSDCLLQYVVRTFETWRFTSSTLWIISTAPYPWNERTQASKMFWRIKGLWIPKNPPQIRVRCRDITIWFLPRRRSYDLCYTWLFIYHNRVGYPGPGNGLEVDNLISPTLVSELAHCSS